MICLLAGLVEPAADWLRIGPAMLMISLSLLTLPAMAGWVGGYHAKWSITLLSAPAILLAVSVPQLVFSCAQGDRSAEWEGPPLDFMVPFLLVVLAAMLGISALFHLVARARRRPRFPPGHCRKCGRDLGFRVDEPCPACGEAVLCGGCGYNLTGNVSGICPECGRTIGTDDRLGGA